MNSPQITEPFQFQSEIVDFGEKKQEKTTTYLLTCLLSERAIDHWLEQGESPIDLTVAINKLTRLRQTELEEVGILAFLKQTESKELGNLGNELSLRLERAFSQCSVDSYEPKSMGESLEYVRTQLAQWSLQSTVVKQNGESLRTKLSNKYKNIFFCFRRASVERTLDFLAELQEFLVLLGEDYQKASRELSEEKEGFWRTYNRHLLIIQAEDENNLAEVQKSFQIARQSILKAHNLRIDSEVHALAAHSLKALELKNQLYIDSLKKGGCFLREIREDLRRKNKKGRRGALVFWADEELVLERLREKIEAKLGHTLTVWGDFGGITKEMVKSALFEQLEPIANKICVQTFNQLNQEFGQT